MIKNRIIVRTGPEEAFKFDCSSWSIATDSKFLTITRDKLIVAVFREWVSVIERDMI